MIRFLLVLVIGLSTFLQAYSQIPFMHHFDPLNGNVLKVEKKHYKKVKVDSMLVPNLNLDHSSRELIKYKNGKVSEKNVFRYSLGEEKLLNKFVYHYLPNGQLSKINEFEGSVWEKPGILRLRRVLTPFYTDGKISREEARDVDGELIVSFDYEYTATKEGHQNILLHATNSKSENNKKKFKIGVTLDKAGRELQQYMIADRDTFFNKNVHAIVDNIGHIDIYEKIGSRINKTSGIQHYDRDSMLNPVLINSEYQINGKEKKRFAAITLRYQYAGDPGWKNEAIKIPLKSRIVGKWKNEDNNIALTIGKPPGEFPAGIFSVEAIDPILFGLMDMPEGWVYELLNAHIGEWVLDEEKNILIFKQMDHIVCELKLTFDGYDLILNPKDNRQSKLRLSR